MKELVRKLAVLTPSIAALGAVAVSAHETAPQQRALKLDIVERGDQVELQLIANSRITQQVRYEIELTGSSNARSRGDIGVASGQRQVLSHLKTSFTDTWCAKVHVSEDSGQEYTLTAGDCRNA